ncbi:hypothetical protein BH10BAC6_BH10BAC6_03400 [soil metagenome]
MAMMLLAQFDSEIEAQLVEAQLRDAGIDYHVVHDDAGGTLPSLTASNGVKVMVFEDDLEEAREILEARATDDDPLPPDILNANLDLIDGDDDF